MRPGSHEDRVARRDFDHVVACDAVRTREGFEAIADAVRAIAATMEARTGRVPAIGGHRVDRPPVLTRRHLELRGFAVRRTPGTGRRSTVVVGPPQWRRRRSRGPSIGRIDLFEAAVVAAVETLEPGTLLVDSTWTGLEWRRATDVAAAAMGRDVAIPRIVLMEDRWCGPTVRRTASRCELRFCVDGRAYAIDRNDGRSVAFADHVEAARWIGRAKRAGSAAAWDPEGGWPVDDREAAIRQDERFDALFEHGDDARIVHGLGIPEPVEPEDGPDPRSFEDDVERIARDADRFDAAWAKRPGERA